MVCPDFGWISIFLSTPNFRTDEVNEQAWQLITAICDEGDGLTLCEQCYDCTHCHVTFKLLYCGEFSAIS
jgi:hypothetical protein